MASQVYRVRGFEAFKLSGGDGESRAVAVSWLGPLEALVLTVAHDNGLLVFTPSELKLYIEQKLKVKVDRRRLSDALKRLTLRGLLERLERGLYRLTVGALELLYRGVVRALPSGVNGKTVKDKPSYKPWRPVKDSYGTSSRVRVLGVLFDNVRGVLWSGGFSGGDVGGYRCWRDLVFFREVRYCEVGWLVSGLPSVPRVRLVKVYWKPRLGGWLVEVVFRRGFVRRFVVRAGVAGLVHVAWAGVVSAFKALYSVLRCGPVEAFGEAVGFAGLRLGGGPPPPVECGVCGGGLGFG